MNTSKHKAYKSLDAVLPPLLVFFAILTAHFSGRRTMAPVYFYRYIDHIMALAQDYEWAAVLKYHDLFFNRRRADMHDGTYETWAVADYELLNRLVYPYRKQINIVPKNTKRAPSSPGESCRKFNAGKCESPCAWNRPHTCSAPGCGKDHPFTQHK
ncbi:Integrase/recombinase xerD [Favolaschia claudopus]|uniref:Integrase/recombinase xerD n=1 Tax=Favolaschia claudopus TaxID=2862362 RepID=A0AAW0E101_9AGAR